jgi:hypothetical protein
MAKIDLLSAAKVKSVKKPGYYLDGRGLYLQVRNETSKSWLLKYSINKRPRAMGLGSAFDFSLADAREQRDELRKLIKRGIDPLEQKAAEKQAKKSRPPRRSRFGPPLLASSPANARAGKTKSMPGNGRRRSKPMLIR